MVQLVYRIASLTGSVRSVRGIHIPCNQHQEINYCIAYVLTGTWLWMYSVLTGRSYDKLSIDSRCCFERDTVDVEFVGRLILHKDIFFELRPLTDLDPKHSFRIHFSISMLL